MKKKIYILETGLRNPSSHFFYIFSTKEKAIEFNGGTESLFIEGQLDGMMENCNSALSENIIDSNIGINEYY